VVGDTTYGKGIVQTVFTLAPDLALRMTTARWYTPSGRSIQGAVLDSAMGAAKPAEATTRLSSGGRPLHASNGLVPDMVLAPDTLTTAESVFAQSLGDHVPEFRDVLTAYALEIRKGGSVGSEAFEVTAAMRTEVAQRLRERGVAIPDSVFEGGSRIVGQQLGYEIARYSFGSDAERRRRAAEDIQVLQAIDLVRGTSSPRALLGLAAPAADQAH
jgi:carboxyl-terminal processing protease